jgi:protein Mpv17
VLCKIAVDQLCWSPVFVVAFFSIMGLLSGESPLTKVKANFVTSMLATWSVWPAVHCVNFSLVPSHLRVAYVNMVQVGFSAYLSVLANGSEKLHL